MKNILFINSALSSKCVCLIVNNQTRIRETSGFKADLPNILSAIENLCKQAEIALHDIDAVCVVLGPGNFSALRVGCIVAMTLASQLKIDLFAVDSLSVLSQIAKSKNVCMSASKNEFYEFDLQQQIILKSASDLKIDSYDLCDFDKKFLEQNNLDISNVRLLEISDLENFCRDENFWNFISAFKSPKIIEPLYIKPPNIHVKD